MQQRRLEARIKLHGSGRRRRPAAVQFELPGVGRGRFEEFDIGLCDRRQDLFMRLVDFNLPGGQVDNVTDPNAGALLGIAVTAADRTNGSWWYSIDGGSNWNALGSESDGNARLPAAIPKGTALQIGLHIERLAEAVDARDVKQLSAAADRLGKTANYVGIIPVCAARTPQCVVPRRVRSSTSILARRPGGGK